MMYKRDPELIRDVLGKKVQFILGDIACVYGGLLAGCSFFGGYPITPASEVAEGMARRLPRVKGTYIQMEDEIGSIAAVIGAAWGGAKSMTATSGPGMSLMLENLGLGLMMEIPCIIVNGNDYFIVSDIQAVSVVELHRITVANRSGFLVYEYTIDACISQIVGISMVGQSEMLCGNKSLGIREYPIITLSTTNTSSGFAEFPATIRTKYLTLITCYC